LVVQRDAEYCESGEQLQHQAGHVVARGIPSKQCEVGDEVAVETKRTICRNNASARWQKRFLPTPMRVSHPLEKEEVVAIKPLVASDHQPKADDRESER